jgi:hypothetical protein
MPENQTTASRRQPGEDHALSQSDPQGLTILNAVRDFRDKARDARRTRLKKNRRNREAFMGLQDFSYKIEGQSTEFLPKTATAVEQFVSFVKKAMTQFGAYYDPIISRGGNSPLTGDQIRLLMDCFLEDLVTQDNVRSTFPVLVSDAVKTGALESLIIMEISGAMVPERVAEMRRGELVEAADGTVQESEPTLEFREESYWKLRVELIRQEDYFPDPTGRGLYEITETAQDFHRVKELADQGVYDAAAVRQIENDFRMEAEDARQAEALGQDEVEQPAFRKEVKITNFWGTLLDSEGNVTHRNVNCVIANDQYILVQPRDNPFWHGESPFVAVPLIRVPFSVWHKALMDNAVQLNLASNELFNLMLDGGMSAVHGIKQVRIDDLESPGDASGGFPAGTTIAVKNSLPYGSKVLETVSEGQVPPDAMAMFESIDREFASAALSSELKLGALPGGEVLATSIVEQSQAQATTIDGIVADAEREWISPALRKIFLTILQHLDDVKVQDINDALGPEATFALRQLSAAERYTTFASRCSFKVHGLTGMLAKAKEFQKLMAFVQVIMSAPMLMESFFRKYSPDKIVAHMMKSLSINPEQMARDEREMGIMDQQLAAMQQMAQMAGGGSSAGGPTAQEGTQSATSVGGPGTGGSSMAAEVNQAAG